MPVRSNRFARGATTVGSTVRVYTVPAGKTAIVKDVVLWGFVGGVSRFALYAVSGAAQVAIVDQAIGGFQSARFSGLFVVLEPGDSLQVFSQGAAAQFWTSGAELDGVA